MSTPIGDSPPLERWGAGDAYESYIGRWSREVAAAFVPWLGVAPGSRWLDVGCGTGALTGAVLALSAPEQVLGVDPSPGFVAHATRAHPSERVRFEVGEAEALGSGDETFDGVISGLVLNFVPRPDRALAEMARVTRAGGVVGLYVWDYAGDMQYLRTFWDAAVALDPAALDLDEGRRFPICRPEALERLANDAGLQSVTTRAIDVVTRFSSFDDYWAPFLGGQGPAPSYVMSLPATGRADLRDRLRMRLPTSDDGAIRLVARAWAVRGLRGTAGA